MYTNYLHGITDTEVDLVSPNLIIPDQTVELAGQTLTRGTRVSLTIRHVPKTLKKFKLKF
jgi:alkylated DNA repair protein alkB family protein 6